MPDIILWQNHTSNDSDTNPAGLKILLVECQSRADGNTALQTLGGGFHGRTIVSVVPDDKG